MAGEIQRNIILNATTRGFGDIGSTLTQLGVELDQVSQKIINFGKSSLETYKDYEYNMTQARIAQATRYGKGTDELDKAMASLDEYAKYWAKTTIFHTKDVSNAIMDASRAGLNAQEIISSMPAIMQLAQAGGLDLTQTLEMVMKSMRALGYDVNTEIADFTDAWVFAANYSMGSVEEFGRAMMKMGATMRFTDSKEELMALIGLMHDMGTSGSESATLLRTSIMRILAPSGVASRTMKLLGATDDEIKSVMEDKQKLEALNWLESMGFSAFDATGQAKPILQIYAELGEVLAGVSGGYENIAKNETALGVLGVIFGNRGITGAINIVSALQKAVELRDKILSGEAEGYGEYGQALMMDTLYGSTEIFESKVEELERRTGEALSTQVREVQEQLGGIVDSLNFIDDSKFSVLITGFKTLAALGPGLTFAGWAFRGIASLLTPTGGIALLVAGVTAAAIALRELQETNFAEGFGMGDLDARGIMDFVGTLGSDFTEAYKEVDKFRESVNTAKEAYSTASQTFSSSLLSAVITGNTMTAAEQEKLEGLGLQMYSAVQQGLTDAQNASLAYWNMLFGGDVTDSEFENIQKIINAGYEDTLSQAANIHTGIHDILMKGFQGGFTPEDYDQIMEYMKEYNAMVARAAAEAQDRENYINQQELLHKAQTASLDQIQQLSIDIAAERDRILAEAAANHMREVAGLEYDYNRLIEQGKATKEDKNAAIEAANERYAERELAQRERYDELFMTLWGTQISQSDYGAAYSGLQDIAQRLVSGDISNLNQARFLWSGSRDVSKSLAMMLEGYGGIAGLAERIEDYRKNGNFDMANSLAVLGAMHLIDSGAAGLSSELTNTFIDATGRAEREESAFVLQTAQDELTDLIQRRDKLQAERDKLQAQYDAGTYGNAYAEYAASIPLKDWDYFNGGRLESLNAQIAAKMAEIAALTGADDAITRSVGDWDIDGIVDGTIFHLDEEIEDYLEGALRDLETAVWTHLERAEAGLDIDNSKQDLLENIEVYSRLAKRYYELHGEVYKDDRAFSATLEEGIMGLIAYYKQANAAETEYVNSVIPGRQKNISGEGKPIFVRPMIDTTDIDNYTPPVKYGTVIYHLGTTNMEVPGRGNEVYSLFAEGGRATAPSIFGEGGIPEWAIPEEHSARTAELLNAARAASGFTWPEILSRFGGLNADAHHTPTTIVYSPTINANDVTGVREALDEDKRRMERWFNDKKLRDEIEVYA